MDADSTFGVSPSAFTLRTRIVHTRTVDFRPSRLFRFPGFVENHFAPPFKAASRSSFFSIALCTR